MVCYNSYRILQDETYTGTLVQGKQGTPHYKIKQMEQRHPLNGFAFPMLMSH